MSAETTDLDQLHRDLPGPLIARGRAAPFVPGLTSRPMRGIVVPMEITRAAHDGTAVYAAWDLLLTQQVMRHASPATTAGYALVVADRAAAVVHELPGAARVNGRDER